MRPKKGAKYLQGFFRPRFPEKYKGDHNRIVYRSSWELRVMIWLDSNNGVLEWSSEEMFVPYVSPLDNKPHRYFVDFVIKIRTPKGEETHLVEVKPEAEIQPPKKPKKVSKAYYRKVTTYMVNQAKWDAARAYCTKKGWLFTTLNEYDIGLKKR
jgi:hypothetical protein